MNDVMRCPGTSAAESKSVADSPELCRDIDLSECNLTISVNPSQPRGSCLDMTASQSIRYCFFSCCSGLKHLIHFIPWRWSPKSAHLIWATDFIQSEAGDFFYVSVGTCGLVTSFWLGNLFGHQTNSCWWKQNRLMSSAYFNTSDF